MELSKISQILVLLGSTLGAAAPMAVGVEDDQGCANCEATVVVDAAKAQDYATALMAIDSMPLHAVTIDAGRSGGTARLLVMLPPAYAQQNSLNSFDVAKKLVDLTQIPTLAALSITATWDSPLDQRDFLPPAEDGLPVVTNVGTIGH